MDLGPTLLMLVSYLVAETEVTESQRLFYRVVSGGIGNLDVVYLLVNPVDYRKIRI